jgi:O-methyltransferase
MVECGVWRGGSMMLIAHALTYFGDTNRRFLLYDTFAGMTEPDDIDIDYDDRATRPIWIDAQKKGLKMGFGGGVDEVKANLRSTGYPEAKARFRNAAKTPDKYYGKNHGDTQN